MAPTFSGIDYLLALPITLLTLFALGILLIDLMIPPETKWANAVTALIGVLFATGAVIKIQLWMQESPTTSMGAPGMMGTVLVDRLAIYFFWLFLAGAGISILMSVRYMKTEHENHGEYYALMLLSVVGMMCMAAGLDIVLIFIGLELMAISTYVLVGFLRRNRRSNEAALKYLLLGAFSSGIFAYGLSLLYGLTGSTNLIAIRSRLAQLLVKDPHNPIAIVALVTTMAGLLFKIAAVPFHQWAPDAYEGAPTCITGFMSVAVKAAGWAMLLRILLWGFLPMRAIWVPMLVFVSIATMTGANFAALTQTNTKRLLAYSSIAHVGYMLLGLIAGTAAEVSVDGIKGILIYLMVYTFMNLGAFGVITSLRHRNVIGDEIDDLNGLYSRAPVEAVLMLIFLLSLAGIPPLAGFWGKYFIFFSLIESGHYVLAALGVLYSVFGAYYYLKMANAMFMGQSEERELLPVSWTMRAALGITAFATLFIGIMPNYFINIVNWSLSIAQNGAMTAQLMR
ncbi:MAG: NADH-quinone oxidoreductase subunit N [Candidatus Sulfotelmatobacter sp.]